MRYIEATGRNPGEERQHSHLYIQISTPEDIAARTGYLPMCSKGWNRSNGEGFSILRGYKGARGLCKICEKRAMLNLPGIEAKGNHKTRWL